MEIIVADGREISAGATGAYGYESKIYPIEGFDYVSGTLVLHAIFGGADANSREFSYLTEVSLDRATWVPQGIQVLDVDDVNETPRLDVGEINGRYLRVSYGYALDDTPPGSVLFSLTLSLTKRRR